MTLTDAQIGVLGADIAQDPDLAKIPNTPDGAVEIALRYDALAGAEAVWRTRVPRAEVLGALDWVAYLGLDDPHRDALALLMTLDVVNLAEPIVRKAFGDVLGMGALDPIAKREMTRAERLFAEGPDGEGIFTLTFEGPLSPQDTQRARDLP